MAQNQVANQVTAPWRRLISCPLLYKEECAANCAWMAWLAPDPKALYYNLHIFRINIQQNNKEEVVRILH
jgi:hypothetical protein